MAEVQFENGNLHSPVIVVGEDPNIEGNVLAVRLGTSVSLPAGSLTSNEGTPTDEEGNAVTSEATNA